MSETVLEMRNVTKRFPGVIALKDVNLEVKKGEILGICGENGAGKSTLMKVLSGSYPEGTFEGEIWVDGEKKSFANVFDAQNAGIEMIYQELNMMLDASAAENMYVGNLPTKGPLVNFRKLYKDTAENLETVKLDISPKMKVRKLNAGQQQMISLMRACVKEPKILVLDEPTSALTDAETDILMELLDNIRKNGQSCIYISHKLEEIFRICDRVTVMRDGQTVTTYNVTETNLDQLVRDMVGREVSDYYPKVDIELGEEVFRVENLTVPHPSIAHANILENVSFNLKKGEILGIGGLVGAGRSEALSAIFGLYKKGVTKKVFINGVETKMTKPTQAIKAGIGYLTEERKTNGIIWMHSVMQNLSLAIIKDLPRKIVLDKKEERKRTQEMFDRLAIRAPSLKTLVVNLSGGNQQKVILGRWLLKAPNIIFFDEPTRGIDVGAKAEIYKLMSELAQSGVSIIMVSSDMPELLAMSDRIIVFSNGRITGEFTGDEITDENVMKAAIS